MASFLLTSKSNPAQNEFLQWEKQDQVQLNWSHFRGIQGLQHHYALNSMK